MKIVDILLLLIQSKQTTILLPENTFSLNPELKYKVLNENQKKNVKKVSKIRIQIRE